MAILALILSVTAVLVAVATFMDKFFSDPKRDDRWRHALIDLFIKIDRS